MQDLKVSLIQTHQIWEDKKENLNHFETLLKQVQPHTKIVIFPEMFHTGFSMNATLLSESMQGKGVKWLQTQAKKYDTAMVTSLIIEENKSYYNRMVFVHPDGKVDYYNKRKLFGLAKEDQTYTPGNEKIIIRYEGWKILLQVCYDLRFPSIQRNKVINDNYDYDVIINVANWPEKRRVHWKTLTQARAIENQCYLIGVNRIGKGNGLEYSGDSAVISPLGEIEGRQPNIEQIINTSLSVKGLKTVREKLPFLKDS